MKIDSSLMFDPVKVREMAPQLEEAGFDGAYTFEGQSDPFISVAAAAWQCAAVCAHCAVYAASAARACSPGPFAACISARAGGTSHRQQGYQRQARGWKIVSICHRDPCCCTDCR